MDLADLRAPAPTVKAAVRRAGPVRAAHTQGAGRRRPLCCAHAEDLPGCAEQARGCCQELSPVGRAAPERRSGRMPISRAWPLATAQRRRMQQCRTSARPARMPCTRHCAGAKFSTHRGRAFWPGTRRENATAVGQKVFQEEPRARSLAARAKRVLGGSPPVPPQDASPGGRLPCPPKSPPLTP